MFKFVKQIGITNTWCLVLMSCQHSKNNFLACNHQGASIQALKILLLSVKNKQINYKSTSENLLDCQSANGQFSASRGRCELGQSRTWGTVQDQILQFKREPSNIDASDDLNCISQGKQLFRVESIETNENELESHKWVLHRNKNYSIAYTQHQQAPLAC